MEQIADAFHEIRMTARPFVDEVQVGGDEIGLIGLHIAMHIAFHIRPRQWSQVPDMLRE